MEILSVKLTIIRSSLLLWLFSITSVSSSPLRNLRSSEPSFHKRSRRQIKESELMLREICQIGNGEFRHPFSCNSYLQCVDGMYTEKVCPGNMVYDIHIKACNYKRKVRCTIVDGLSEFFDNGATSPSTTTTTTTTTEEPEHADDGSDGPDDSAVDETTTLSTTEMMKKTTHMRTKKTASATVFYYRQADPTTRDENEVTTTTKRTVPRPTIFLTKLEVPRLHLASMEDAAPGVEELNMDQTQSKIKMGIVQMDSLKHKIVKSEQPTVKELTSTEVMVPRLEVIDMTLPAKSEEEDCVIWEDE